MHPFQTNFSIFNTYLAVIASFSQISVKCLSFKNRIFSHYWALWNPKISYMHFKQTNFLLQNI